VKAATRISAVAAVFAAPIAGTVTLPVAAA